MLWGIVAILAALFVLFAVRRRRRVERFDGAAPVDVLCKGFASTQDCVAQHPDLQRLMQARAPEVHGAADDPYAAAKRISDAAAGQQACPMRVLGLLPASDGSYELHWQAAGKEREVVRFDSLAAFQKWWDFVSSSAPALAQCRPQVARDALHGPVASTSTHAAIATTAALDEDAGVASQQTAGAAAGNAQATMQALRARPSPASQASASAAMQAALSSGPPATHNPIWDAQAQS